MRELKFRVWSIKEKFMHTVSSLDWTVAYGRWYGPGVGKGVFYLDPTYKGETSINELDSILMQYTGLKDKNGVEIYEGDILKVFDWGNKKQLLATCEMVWDIDETGWNFEPFIIEDRYDFRKAISNCEIIGNIHEKPRTF